MQWLNPHLRSSICGFLGFTLPPSDSVLEQSLDDVRDAMLLLLGESPASHYPQLTWRIRYAPDILALWYLRGELMAVLCTMRCEAIARRQIADISAMFDGMLPKGLHSRPTPLA